MISILSLSDFLPNTIWAWQHVLSLPVHPLVSEDDLYRIIKIFETTM